MSLEVSSSDLESIIGRLKQKKLTGLLKVTSDACDGLIIFVRGIICDAYEIFNNELLVKDRGGRTIVQRYKVEPGKVKICTAQPAVLKILLKTVRKPFLNNSIIIAILTKLTDK